MSLDKKIRVIDEAIRMNLDLDIPRGFLSQNILAQLRNLVETIAVKIYADDKKVEDVFLSYEKSIKPALKYMSSQGKYRFLTRFHFFLQNSAGHYTPEPENAERLMLKYYENLQKIRLFLRERYSLNILHNLDSFPISKDKQLLEYYTSVARIIKNSHLEKVDDSFMNRYYIRKIRPFFIDNEIYYEVSFAEANDKINKLDRIIAYTKHDILDNYAVKFSVKKTSINISGLSIPTLIIDEWETSIRPCEFDNMAQIFNLNIKISSENKDYKRLMRYLTENRETLNFLLQLEETEYTPIKNEIFPDPTTKLASLLQGIRTFLSDNKIGSNVILYLLFSMRNSIIKRQSRYGKLVSQNPRLSLLKLRDSCLPFELMPYCTSLPEHNPNIDAIFACIPFENRYDELMVRKIKAITENTGNIYIKREELKFENIDSLINSYNKKLYSGHSNRQLETYKDYIYIKEYETEVAFIIQTVLEKAQTGIKNYSKTAKQWFEENKTINDSKEKEDAIVNMFENSRVAAVYGSAGVGKTTLIKLLASFLAPHTEKLFLAVTHPAVDNLKRRVSVANSEFMTIAKFLHAKEKSYDIIFIDECSTVSNKDMCSILKNSNCRLLVLVGDFLQIQSITFGNWFELLKSFMPREALIELQNPYRTRNKNLLELWKHVRENIDTITELLVQYNYVSNLDDTVFTKTHKDEIILCLNYDGLYGINNINKILQGNNTEKEIKWGVNTYKVNDPILFNESSERFAPLLYNNLKGTIKRIEKSGKKIFFEIALDKPISELDLVKNISLVGEDEKGNSIIRLFVSEPLYKDNEDRDNYDDIIPFNISYASSIHKSQGIEFESVKIVISDEIDEMITHNIFYTAITRTKQYLKIYWSPEIQTKIIQNLNKSTTSNSAPIIANKFGWPMNKKQE